jgi:hypothetical protein
VFEDTLAIFEEHLASLQRAPLTRSCSPWSPSTDALACLAHPINLRRATYRPVLFGTLCENIEISRHPKHSGPGLWPKRFSLIGHPAQYFGATAPVRSILDSPDIHHGRLNAIAVKVKNVADVIITTAKMTGTERKLMWPYSARHVGPGLFKITDVFWFQSCPRDQRPLFGA